MKAYHTHIKGETGEDAIHNIVFAETHSQAKYRSEAYGECDWKEISARRVPKFDQYAENGKIPISAMIEDGWLYECDKCRCGACANNLKDGFVYCDNCLDGIELAQSALNPTELPSEAAAEDKVYGNDCRNGQC